MTTERGPLETWHAEEFLAHLDRGLGWHRRASFGAPRRPTSRRRARCSSDADRHAADSGFLHGPWLDGTLVGGLLYRVFDAATGSGDRLLG
ncbi:GNAT family protein [Streptomyces violaceorubidus]